MLANTAVQIAAIMVQTTMHTLPLARILSPCASPMNPEPVAKLLVQRQHVVRSHVKHTRIGDLHPCQKKETTGNFSCDRPCHDGSCISDVVNATVLSPKCVHDIRIIFMEMKC
jgi:hypothetical protein